MAVELPITVERNSTFKMKVTLKNSQGFLPLQGIKFEGEVKDSIYDTGGYPIKFDVVDPFNGAFFMIIDAEAPLDFHRGTYVVRYVAQDGAPYRLMEGPVDVDWEGGTSQTFGEVPSLTINMTPTPEIITTATVGLPGPKLTYQDLTDTDKEDLRKGVYEAVQDQVDVAVEAKEKAEVAGTNAQDAAKVIQDTYLPEVRTLHREAQGYKRDAEAAATTAKQDGDKATLHASEVATMKADIEQIQTDVTTKQGEAAQSATNAAQSATSARQSSTASSGSSGESKGFRDEAEQFKDQAKQYADEAKKAGESAFQSGGTFTPTAQTQYPQVPTQDTRWTLKAFTWTSGSLDGETCVDGDTLLYDLQDAAFTLLRTGGALLGNPITEIEGADGVVVQGPRVTLTATMAGARPSNWVPVWNDVQGKPEFATRWPTAQEAGALADTYVPDWASVTNKPETATRWPTAGEVGALPDTYAPAWGDLTGIPELEGKMFLDTATSGDLTGHQRIALAVPTATSVSRVLKSDVKTLLVKDTSGNAKVRPITITPESGYTINGAASEVIDKNYGWVVYMLSGTNYITIAGA